MLDCGIYPDYYRPVAVTEEVELSKRIGVILGTVNVVRIFVSVITLIVFGLKYMIDIVEGKNRILE